jgi:membrane protease YdiL (CAAX protease family)
MNTGTLPVNRPFSKKVFIFLVMLIVPAVYAALPYTMTVASITLDVGEWLIVLVASLLDVALYSVLAAIGLYLAARIGLGLPFVEGWLEKSPEDVSGPVTVEESPRDFKGMLVFSVVVGVIIAIVIIVLDLYGFEPLLQAELERFGITDPGIPQPPPWQSVLVSFSAGINEEVIFRLFGLTVLAWLGGLVFHDTEGRPTAVVLWIAAILTAVLFGLAHLPLTMTVGLPLTPLIVTRAGVLNGVAGIVLGWLYWTRGLESAMVAHFSADIVLHVILVFVLQSL